MTDDSPSRSDEELLAAHLAGQDDAFAEIVRRHQQRLWGLAVRTLRDREEAADALQDAMLSAYRNAASFRGESQVVTWLHRVVLNACLDRMRRAKARPADPLPEQEPATRVDEHARAEARMMLHAALAQLPEHQRVAVVLVDLHELSVAEAAQVLDVAEGTVKSRCARGRYRLAELLRPSEPSLRAPSPTEPRPIEPRPIEHIAGERGGGNRSGSARVDSPEHRPRPDAGIVQHVRPASPDQPGAR